jgi:hypothetical protein
MKQYTAPSPSGEGRGEDKIIPVDFHRQGLGILKLNVHHLPPTTTKRFIDVHFRVHLFHLDFDQFHP